MEILESPTAPIDLLVQSPTKAGARTRGSLLAYDLIEVLRGCLVGVKRGIPLGREFRGDESLDNPVIVPELRSKEGVAWRHTQGRCAYCGAPLSFSYQFVAGRYTDNGVHLAACKGCHSSRGSKSLEEYRFEVQMSRFEAEHGIRFSREQVAFLESELRVSLEVPGVEFWFETFADT
ncbi:MAG: hypothetical protein AB2807_09945 [Candidatus Sedimenticola endophacoides]